MSAADAAPRALGAAIDLPPALRARLKSLRLRTRMTPHGAGLGAHAGRQRGAGLEFAQYRAYEPGDEPRLIDWKLYARSDRFFVRESLRDSPLTAWLLVDATASMGQADAARPGWRKFDAALRLAACVGEVALQQGDRFGVVAAGGGRLLEGAPAGSGPRHRDCFRLALQALRCGGRWPEAAGAGGAALRPLWERLAPGDLVIVLSDFFDDALAELALRLAKARREVVAVQLLSAEERDFPYAGGHWFRDPETGAELRLDAGAARADFLQRFGAARATLARRLASGGVALATHVLDEAIDVPLRRLFGDGRGALDATGGLPGSTE